ncbi:hypothetical protein [Kingella potus]|uniref:hypothetical protein n=1 Tax=Kingella potus TaxID=265175 RepID=UPI0011C07F06|nr:hypothetical protein [Kingella potus]UOP00078.1 hypothetical protein LVJ84_08815 [Kingella potus]
MKIHTTSDGFKWTSVSNFCDELEGLQTVLDKFNSFPFNLGVCLRALEKDGGWTSKSRYLKSDNYLDMDIVVYENRLLPIKNDLDLKRKIFGEEFYNFFCDVMKKYEKRFPELKNIRGCTR